MQIEFEFKFYNRSSKIRTTFNIRVSTNVQERRITVAAALSHPYVDEGRLRYHTCMCQCCPNLPDGVRYTSDAEPVCSTPFHYVFEDELNSISRVKGLDFLFILLIGSVE